MTVTAMPNGEAPARGSSRTRLIIIGVVVLVLLAVVAYFFLKPKAAPIDPSAEPAAQTEFTEAELGAIQDVDSVQINIADGHYLNIEFAMQLTTHVASGGHTAEGGIEDSKALDAAIHVFTNQPLDKLTQPADIDTYVAELLARVQEAYPNEVAAIYLRKFVTQ